MEIKKFLLFGLNMVITTFILLNLLACSAIQPYSLTKIEPDTNNTIVLMPATGFIMGYDSTLAVQWNRTYNHCAQIKRAIVKEIDERERKLISRKNILLGFGGITALSNTLYSGIVETPKREITTPLGLVSGTAIISMLPSFTQDKRLGYLQEKLENIKTIEYRALIGLNEIEKVLTEKGVHDQTIHPDSFNSIVSMEEWDEIQLKLRTMDIEIEELSGQLRELLIQWANAAQ
jgi:hypothetical protein